MSKGVYAHGHHIEGIEVDDRATAQRWLDGRVAWIEEKREEGRYPRGEVLRAQITRMNSTWHKAEVEYKTLTWSDV